MTRTQHQTETETRVEESPDPRFLVVVHNDPVNLMSYVVLVFKKVLGMNREEASRHMMEVHHLGRSIVWSGPREPAELRVNQLQSWHLTVTLEPDHGND